MFAINEIKPLWRLYIRFWIFILRLPPAFLLFLILQKNPFDVLIIKSRKKSTPEMIYSHCLAPDLTLVLLSPTILQISMASEQGQSNWMSLRLPSEIIDSNLMKDCDLFRSP